MNRSRDDLLEMTNVFASKLILYSILAIILYALLSPYWLKVAAYGFVGTQAEIIAVNLIWLLAPALLFLIIFSICESIFLSYSKFKIPAYASLFSVMGTLGGIIFLTKYMGIYGVVIGTTVGMFFTFIFPYLLLRRKIPHSPLAFDLKNYKLDMTEINLLPVILYGVIFQVIISIDRLFATHIGEGMASSLTYASNLSLLLPVVIASSTCVSILPKLSQSYAAKDFKSLSIAFGESFRGLIFIIIPFSTLLLVAGDLIVKLLLEHGRFDSIASENTIIALKLYAIGSVAQSLWIFTMGTFISLGRVRNIPLYGLFFLGITVVLDYIFMNLLGYMGLPLATSLVFFIQFIFFYNLMKRDFRIQIRVENHRYVSKVVIAALIMGGVVWLAKNTAVSMIETLSFSKQLILLGFLCALGSVVYFTISKLIGSDISSSFFRSTKDGKALNKIVVTR
jgi:putative peptidoglycan lipid II flippase